jgi:small subunit ribosomal protein S11
MAEQSATRNESKVAQASRKRARAKRTKQVVDAIAYIKAGFNNTNITITDRMGNTLVWKTPGSSGFKGSRKGTPFAAQLAAEEAGRAAREYGVKSLEILVGGPGPARDPAIKTLANMFKITSIKDITPLPHNGCRPPKRRRV